MRNIEKILWSRLSMTASGCAVFDGARKHGEGYGRIIQNGREHLAHRLAFQDVFGPIPAGHLVCHRCDNPPCCNPAHLFVGTQSDNMRDMCSKNRQSRVGSRRVSFDVVERVRAARESSSPPTFVELASMFRISATQAWNYANYKQRQVSK